MAQVRDVNERGDARMNKGCGTDIIKAKMLIFSEGGRLG
jgi:hypothetical protein